VSIELSRDTEQRMIASIKRYFAEGMDEEIGDLKASLLLSYFLEELAPSIYNEAIADARAFMRDKVADLEGTCFEPEFGYWQDEGRKRRGRRGQDPA
jgi:uncharacterized protein (DUF2164 family)